MKIKQNLAILVGSFVALGFTFSGHAHADNICEKGVITNVEHVLEWRISARAPKERAKDFQTSIAFRSDGGNIEKVILTFIRDGFVTNEPTCSAGTLQIVFEYGQLPAILAMWDRANSKEETTFFCSYDTKPIVSARCNIRGKIN